INSPPNFSLIASTNGLDHGSCCGPFGFGGAAGAAGFAPGGGGGGLGTAALPSPAGAAGFGCSAGFSGCWLSFCSSAILTLGWTIRFERTLSRKDVDSTTSIEQVSTPTVYPVTEDSSTRGGGNSGSDG